jgi:hypothetical protein
MAQFNIQNGLQSILQNQMKPNEGPKAFTALLDFSGAVGEWDVDFGQLQEQAYISMVQTLYLDLSGSANPLTVLVGNVGQTIKAKANTQGFYNVLAPNPPRFAFQSTPGGVVIPVMFLNIAIAGVVWATA